MADTPAVSPPTSPELATVYSALRSLGLVIGAIGSIWAFIPTHNLAGLYAWAHTSDAAAAGSALLALVSFGWGLYRKFFDRQIVSAADAVGVNKSNAATIISVPQPGPITPPAVVTDETTLAIGTAKTIDAMRKGKTP